jgi:glutathione S-transferase
MLTFHTHPMSRGRIVRWMLEELGEPYETRVVEYGPMMKAPEYRAINPMGKVPALVHDGRVVTEANAILSYLAEAFPQAGLMPEDRAGFWRWMFFVAGPLEYASTARSMGWEAPADKRGRLGYGSFEDVVATLSQHLEGRDYAVGDRFSVVDVALGAALGWGMAAGTIPAEPAFGAYWDRLKDRPAALRAREIDGRLVAERQAANG